MTRKERYQEPLDKSKPVIDIIGEEELHKSVIILLINKSKQSNNQ